MKPKGVFIALALGFLAVAVSSCSENVSVRAVTSARNQLKLIETSNAAPAQAGEFSIPQSSGEAATNHATRLERFRNLPAQAGFEARSFPPNRDSKDALRYFLFKPKTESKERLPLVLSLHGGGPRHQFEDLLKPHAPGFAYGLGRLVAPETQSKHPSFVVAPWSNNRGWDDSNLSAVLALLDRLQTELNIDSARIYVTGQSMGGFGTWSIITRNPTCFAAAVPICGGGDPRSAPQAKAIPIWAFHGSSDTIVPVEQTRGMIAALLAAGAHPIYWEYAGATHADTAERAYCEPGLIDWMFAQKKTATVR